jgi:quercetin dioxygenase-like cupin family protein
MNASAGVAGGPGGEARGHGPGETSPSPERAAQRLTGPALRFDLAAELEGLRGEPAWARFDRNAKTLAKDGGVRVVLTTLKRGATLDEHRVSAPVVVQTLQGHLRLHLAEPDAGALDLPAGHLALLQPGIGHRVEALEESALLLTVAGGSGEGVQAEAR